VLSMKINLMKSYPKTKRNPKERAQEKTEEHHRIARQFERDFFDGDRAVGYGGYSYRPEFWKGAVEDLASHYKLTGDSAVLDVGCAKGYMLYDLTQRIPNITVKGIDISNWAIANCHPSVRDFLEVGDAKDLSSFEDNEFDLIVSINTIHNLPLEECKQSLRELERVGKACFVTLDSWNTPEEEQKMRDWNLTAQTMMSVKDWESVFKEVGYSGDYYWFIP